MTPWREHASEEAQHDLDRLADSTIAAARNLLDRHGEFLPFPMAVKADGELALIGLNQPERDDPPEAQDVIDGIVDLFRDRRDSLRALAIAADVRIVGEDLEAIEVRIEHREGIALVVLVPYLRDSLDETYEYEEPRASAGEPVIWA